MRPLFHPFKDDTPKASPHMRRSIELPKARKEPSLIHVGVYLNLTVERPIKTPKFGALGAIAHPVRNASFQKFAR
jgi:hypothetical protein